VLVSNSTKVILNCTIRVEGGVFGQIDEVRVQVEISGFKTHDIY